MKFADSWVEDEVTFSVPSFHLQDEVEEHDEVEESKDVCAVVDWRKHILTRPRTSNRNLFELAREIRGVEALRGKAMTSQEYQIIFKKWETASQPHLRTGQDYFTEFLAKLSLVAIPKGQTLAGALARAKAKSPPEKVLVISNERVRLFANLCRELHSMAGGQPIMLHQQSVGKLLGVSHPTIGSWINALKTLGLLKLSAPAVPNVRAARYLYVD